MLAQASATCARVATYADKEDQVGLAMAAALLRCDLADAKSS